MFIGKNINNQNKINNKNIKLKYKYQIVMIVYLQDYNDFIPYHFKWQILLLVFIIKRLIMSSYIIKYKN